MPYASGRANVVDHTAVALTDRPLVSVVVPVYNGGDYLAECLESVVAQDYETWDCTIVDNASNDGTAEIAARFAARDSRIRHLRFDAHVDVTANHNRAFDAISEGSEFCKVVQADDWMYPECLTRMVAAAGVADTVGTVSSYQLWGRRVHLQGLPYDVTFAPGREILRRTLLGEFHPTGGPTATMLRSAFVRERQPFYVEGFRHEDVEAALWMLSRYDFAFVHQVLTFARQQPGARWGRSEAMNAAAAEDVVFLLRYGPAVLEEGEYRARLRELLWRYLRWHIRRAPQLSRLRDPEFFAFHRLKREQILAEAHGEPEVTAAMAVLGALLARDRLVPRVARY